MHTCGITTNTNPSTSPPEAVLGMRACARKGSTHVSKHVRHTRSTSRTSCHRWHVFLDEPMLCVQLVVCTLQQLLSHLLFQEQFSQPSACTVINEGLRSAGGLVCNVETVHGAPSTHHTVHTLLAPRSHSHGTSKQAGRACTRPRYWL